MRTLIVGAGPTALAHLAALRACSGGEIVVWAPSPRASRQVDELGSRLVGGDLRTALEAVAPSHAVIATPIETLVDVASTVIGASVPNVMIEKPGALAHEGAVLLSDLAESRGASVYVGFNRRFYPAVTSALNWLKTESSGVTSGFFDFSETMSVVQRLQGRPAEVRDRWLVANSLHVIDTAFLPTGLPTSVQAVRLGNPESRLTEIHTGRIYAGWAQTKDGAPFSYHANWASGSRWQVEWHTQQGSVFLMPLETAFVASALDPFSRQVLADSARPDGLKPGFVEQAAAFSGGPGRERLFQISLLPELIRIADAIEGLCSSSE